MSNDYATSVLYKADIDRELQNRAAGIDAGDYAIIDRLCDELKSELGIECSCFQDLRYGTIADETCIPIIIKYIPQFTNIGFALELITQQFWRKGNQECSAFLEQWALKLKEERRLTKSVENTLDNAFVKIQDKNKIAFYIELIREKDAFPFTMEMLGKWKDKTALPIIIERLNADTIKTCAITALGCYKDTSLFSYVEPFMSSLKSGEKKAAQKAIERMNKECKQ